MCQEREESRAARELRERLREDPHLLDDVDGFAADMWRHPNFTISIWFGVMCSMGCFIGGAASGPLYDASTLMASLLPILIVVGLVTVGVQAYVDKQARRLLAEAVVRRADVRPRWTPTVEARRLLAQATAPPAHLIPAPPTVPLTEVLMHDEERVTVTAAEGTEGAGGDCCICFAPLQDLPSQQLRGCTHVLHTECWNQWRARNPTCPLCRTRDG